MINKYEIAAILIVGFMVIGFGAPIYGIATTMIDVKENGCGNRWWCANTPPEVKVCDGYMPEYVEYKNGRIVTLTCGDVEYIP